MSTCRMWFFGSELERNRTRTTLESSASVLGQCRLIIDRCSSQVDVMAFMSRNRLTRRGFTYDRHMLHGHSSVSLYTMYSLSAF